MESKNRLARTGSIQTVCLRQLLECLIAMLLPVVPAMGVPLGQSPSPETDVKVVRLGVAGPMTGEAACFGIAMRNGAELAGKQWNNKGGVLGMQIMVVTRDDHGDPAGGVAAYNDLVFKDHVVAIIGPIMSKVALACGPVSQKNRIPMITPTATNPRVTKVGNYVFRACFIDPWQGNMGAKFCFDSLKARRAACLFDDGNDYTKGLAFTFGVKFQKLGGEVVAYESHHPGEKDFGEQLPKILERKPDVLYVSDYYNDTAAIAKVARALGFMGPIVGGDGYDSPSLVEMGGKAVENCYLTNHFHPDDPDPLVVGFNAAYKTEFGQTPDAISALGYDSANLMLEAMQRAGTADGLALANALRDTDLPTVCGQVRFNEDRDPVKPAVILKIQNGKQVFVTRVGP